MELTNQDGEAMAIPAEDSAALMEGIMLHRRGLACVARVGTATDAAATAAATALRATNKTPHRQPLGPQPGGATPAAEAASTATVDRVIGNDEQEHVDRAGEEALKSPDGERSGWEERKESMPQEKEKQDRGGEAGDGMQVDAGAQEPGAMAASGIEEGVGGDVSVSGEASERAVAPGKDDALVTKSDGHKSDPKGKGKGKLKPKPGERATERCLISLLVDISAADE